MKNSYENRLLSIGAEKRERERPIEATIIDIVRHGETEYKEIQDTDFKLDPEQPGFQLAPEYLDLTEEGIVNIQKTAAQLINSIDREHEIVLVVASPQYRAQSSGLIILDSFEKAGIPLLTDELRTADSLHQLALKKDPEIQAEWLEKSLEYRKESAAHAHASPEKAHNETAARMGKELSDIMDEDYDDAERRFNRFLRHYGNLRNRLRPEEQRRIHGKRLRIISITHEEVPTRFMKEALGAETNLQKAQVMELRPADVIPKEGGSIEVNVELLPKPGSDESSQTTTIQRTFRAAVK